MPAASCCSAAIGDAGATAGEHVPDPGMEQVHKLVGGHVQELVQVHAPAHENMRALAAISGCKQEAAGAEAEPDQACAPHSTRLNWNFLKVRFLSAASAIVATFARKKRPREAQARARPLGGGSNHQGSGQLRKSLQLALSGEVEGMTVW